MQKPWELDEDWEAGPSQELIEEFVDDEDFKDLVYHVRGPSR